LENKRTEQILPGRGGGRRGVAQTMCTEVSKYKNDKIKERNKKNKLRNKTFT
jgi:hypothetical protein